MEIYVGGRQTGKTARMVEWVKEGRKIDSYPGWNRVIICSTLDEAQRLRTSDLFNLDYRQVFCLEEWKNGRIPHRNGIAIGIDNADMLLFHLVGGPVDAVSVTGEEPEQVDEEEILETQKELCKRFGIHKSTMNNWHRNPVYKFPQPKDKIGQHALFSVKEVEVWWERWQQIRHA